MSRTRKIGGIVITLLVVMNIVLWMVFPPPNDGRPNFYNQMAAEMFSTSALILMSCGIYLATRPSYLERFFGGLDKFYVVHKSIAIVVITLLLCHFFIIVVTSEGFSLGPSLGKIALIGMLVSVILALAPRIPLLGSYLRLKYHQWRFTHRFTGLFFMIGILHSYRIDNIMQHSMPLSLYVRVISTVGMMLYLYKELVQPLLQRGYPYLVKQSRRLNGTVLEISLSPAAKRLKYRAGQFLFVRFAKQAGLGEAHPFTISSSPDEEEVRLTVKASGDFTQRLYERLMEGAEARLQGAYGRFDYKAGKREQVWVAGGIGITPFLSWVRSFDASPGFDVHLFYTVRSPEEALFWEEIESATGRQPGFHAHLNVTSRDGHLSVEKIEQKCQELGNREIYLCGPYPMVEAFSRSFVKQGVPAGRIHYEEFNFR